MFYLYKVPVHSIGSSDHSPGSAHVLVNFPSFPSFPSLANPSLQINTHSDPNVLLQGCFIAFASDGDSKGGQVLALLITTKNNKHLDYEQVISIMK